MLISVSVVILSGCAVWGDAERERQQHKTIYQLIPREEGPRRKPLADDLQGEGLDAKDRKTIGGGGSSVRGGVIKRTRPVPVRADLGAQSLPAKQRDLLSRGAILDRRLGSLDRDLRGSTLRRSATVQHNRARRAEQERPRLELERRAVESEIQVIRRDLNRSIYEERTRRGGFGGGSPLQSQLDRLRRLPEN